MESQNERWNALQDICYGLSLFGLANASVHIVKYENVPVPGGCKLKPTKDIHVNMFRESCSPLFELYHGPLLTSLNHSCHSYLLPKIVYSASKTRPLFSVQFSLDPGVQLTVYRNDATGLSGEIHWVQPVDKSVEITYHLRYNMPLWSVSLLLIDDKSGQNEALLCKNIKVYINRTTMVNTSDRTLDPCIYCISWHECHISNREYVYPYIYMVIIIY